MAFRFALAVILITALILAIRWFKQTPPAQIRAAVRRYGLYVLVGVVVVLAVTGRLHWLFGLAAGALPFAQRLLALLRAAQIFKQFKQFGSFGIPFPGDLFGGTGTPPGSPATSRIETTWLRMTLDHDTGALSGVVLQGKFRGQTLTDLSLDELRDLLAECRINDEQAVPLLETYLDRQFGEKWRQEGDAPRHERPPTSAMTKEEAYEILGLQPGASIAEIRAAHRRLMQKIHPDRGGSTYLAAKINQAKDLLLNET